MSNLIPDLPFNPKNILVLLPDIIKLLETYGIDKPPNDLSLYRKAFINKSYCTRKNENFEEGNRLCPHGCLPLQEESNERLEFLGDSVLNTTIADYLFERYPFENEGFLTKMRTKLVNGKMLAFLSAKVGLQRYILLSSQIEESNGRTNNNILEDTFEAFIAAIFLDYKSFDIAKSWIIGVVEEYLDFSDLIQMNNNYKDQLLKHYQQNYSYLPKFYEMDVKMQNNAKIYTMCVKDIDDKVIGIGKGGSKKDAENDAARIALGF